MSFTWTVISFIFLLVSYFTVVIKWAEWVNWYKHERVQPEYSITDRLYKAVFRR